MDYVIEVSKSAIATIFEDGRVIYESRIEGGIPKGAKFTKILLSENPNNPTIGLMFSDGSPIVLDKPKLMKVTFRHEREKENYLSALHSLKSLYEEFKGLRGTRIESDIIDLDRTLGEIEKTFNEVLPQKEEKES